jgi:hypothetical protein
MLPKKTLGIAALALGAGILLTPRLCGGQSISYDCGTFTGYPTISGEEFAIPLWNPAANPNQELSEAILSLEVSVSANVDFVYTSDAFPTGTVPDTIIPQYYWFEGGSNNLGPFNGPDSYVLTQAESPMDNVTLQPATGLLPLYSWSGPSLAGVTGTGSISWSADLPAVTIQNANGFEDGVITNANSVTVTETAVQYYYYEAIPEPATLGAVAVGAGVL